MDTYRPFSDPARIEQMVRRIIVFLEQETLAVSILPWGGDPSPRDEHFSNWWKYVSTKSRDPREAYLYWDTRVEDDFLDTYTKRLLTEEGYFGLLNHYFLKAYDDFRILSDRFFQKGASYYRTRSGRYPKS